MGIDVMMEGEVGVLPEGWELMPLKNIIQSSNAGFSCNQSFEDPNGYVHLRTHNITTNGKLNFTKVVRIKQEKVDTRKNFLRRGDILFNNTNSQELVGKTAFVDADYSYGYSNHINRIVVKETVSPQFLVYYLNQLQSSGFFASICNKWIGQAGVMLLN